MVAPREGPAVKPQAAFPVDQVLDVQHELPARLFDVLRAIQQLPDLRERHHAHHQRVVPHLLFVHRVEHDVLEAVLLGARQAVHEPFRPLVEIGQPRRVRLLLVQMGEGQEGRDGVDVLGGRARGQPVREPVEHDLFRAGVARLFVELPDAVQADAVGPLPVVPALGVDDAAIVEAQQEFTRGVLYLDEIADQQLDVAVDVLHEMLLRTISRDGTSARAAIPPAGRRDACASGLS